MIVKGTTDVTPISANKYPPHGNRVWVTRASLPPTLRFEVLGQLDVGKVWYGPAHEVLRSLADGARKLGADAVIEVRTWHQPSGWSWAAPHGSGKAVKILEPAPVDLRSLGGDWQ
jgi:hypothetical protein